MLHKGPHPQIHVRRKGELPLSDFDGGVTMHSII